MATTDAVIEEFFENAAKAAKEKPEKPRGYTGEELRDTCLRKGAYDFLALPSRYGDNLVAHPTAHLASLGI